MRGCFPWFGGALVTASALAQVPASGALPVDLTWQGPVSCTGASQTLAEIRQMLRTDRSSTIAARITVNVQAEFAGESKWSIHVTTVAADRTGERQLLAHSCDEARRAVALLIALMLDPEAHFAEPASSFAPSQVASSTPNSAAPVRSQNKDKPTTPLLLPAPVNVGTPNVRSAPQGFVGADLLADNGSLPSVGVGGRLILGLNARPWAFALRADAWAPQNAQYQGAPGAGVRFNVYDLELAACAWFVHQSPFAFQACLGPELNLFHARGYGVSRPDSATTPTWGAFGELALHYNLVRGVSIRIGVECQAPFQKPKFVIADLGLVFQPSSITERITVGPQFEL